MKRLSVYHYDAFSNIPNKGNPAGVVIAEELLGDGEMKEIARKVGFNETAFVVKSDKADIGIRYFTPGHEMNLCGHATIATIFCLKSREMLDNKNQITIETKAGIIPADIFDDGLSIVIGQTHPQFINYEGPLENLLESIGLQLEDLDTTLPVVYANTGTWTLLLPIAKLNSFSRMMPRNEMFPSVLKEMPKSSIHPFCMETIKPYAHMHGRHFSSPYSGTKEDPVTGTASGAMGAYYATYMNKNIQKQVLIVEQGQEIGRDGEVAVYIVKGESGISISISGTAVYVGDIIL